MVWVILKGVNMICTLYKVGDDLVFYNDKITSQKKQEILDNIKTATLIDCFGNVISDNKRESTYIEFLTMYEYYNAHILHDQIYRNILISPIIVSIVRSELSTLPDGLMCLEKLQPAIELANVGMFSNASAYILSLVPDDMLIDEQLKRWSDLLLSANNIEMMNGIEDENE